MAIAAAFLLAAGSANSHHAAPYPKIDKANYALVKDGRSISLGASRIEVEATLGRAIRGQWTLGRSSLQGHFWSAELTTDGMSFDDPLIVNGLTSYDASICLPKGI